MWLLFFLIGSKQDSNRFARSKEHFVKKIIVLLNFCLRDINPDDQDVMLTTNFSLATETVAVLIQQIPNQPLKFFNDPLQKKRSEDALIAWGWKKFIDDTSNPDMLLRLPMTKAAVKCMDTVEDFIKQNYFLNIKKFMIAGKSKRGWTTWTTVKKLSKF